MENIKNDAHIVWNNILDKLGENKREFKTVPKTNKQPIWFSAYREDRYVYVESAIENMPSSKISTRRKLSFKVFEKVYPLYLKRENGEAVSKEVIKVTVNQVYYFSLIKHLG